MKQYFDYFVVCLRIMIFVAVASGGLLAPIVLTICCHSAWWSLTYIVLIPATLAALLYMEDVI